MTKNILILVKALLLPMVAVSAIMLSATPSFSQAPGLVSYWPGNGNYGDVVGGNNGTPFGGVGFGAGKFGQAFDLDGSTGGVFVPDAPSLAITGSIAMSAWVYYLGLLPGNLGGQILWRGDDRAGLDPYSLTAEAAPSVEAPGYYLWFDLCNGTDYTSIFAPLPVGTWVFESASYDASSQYMQILEDGKLEGAAATTVAPFGPLVAGDDPCVGIGSDGNHTGECFYGSIEEVRLYNAPGPVVYPIQLKLSKSSIKGGQTVAGRITVDDAPFQTLRATVLSGNATAIPPATVSIGYGHIQSASFAIKTLPVTSPQKITISATINGTTVTTTLTIKP